MHDGGGARLVEPMQVRHRRIEREEGIERQRRRRAVERERLVAAQPTQSGSPTGATAASPSSAPRSTITSRRGSRPFRARELRQHRPRRTARRRRAATRGGSGREFIGSSSSPLEFGRHEQQRQRLRPALGARDGLARLGRSERPERLASNNRLRIGRAGHPARELVGDVEPLRQPVEPGGVCRRESPSAPAAATAARPAGSAPASPAGCSAG